MRVILVDDSALIRDGLARLLADDGIDVVATFSDTAGVLAAVERHQPDVLVVDVRMPPAFETEGLELGVLPRNVVHRREAGTAPPRPPCGRR